MVAEQQTENGHTATPGGMQDGVTNGGVSQAQQILHHGHVISPHRQHQRCVALEVTAVNVEVEPPLVINRTMSGFIFSEDIISPLHIT